MNVRLPERAMGDLRAQITAVTTGERRFTELRRALRQGRRARFDVASSWISPKPIARANTRNIPDGVYEAEVLHGR